MMAAASARSAVPPARPGTPAWEEEPPPPPPVPQREAFASHSSQREMELQAKNEVLTQTAAELSAEVFKLKQQVSQAKDSPNASSPASPRSPLPPKTTGGGPQSPRWRRTRRTGSPPKGRNSSGGLRSRSPPHGKSRSKDAQTQVPLPGDAAGKDEELGGESALVAERVRVAGELEKVKEDLHGAIDVIEKQRLELETVRGRSTALRVANEMVTHDGMPWNQKDVARFHAISRSPPPHEKAVYSDDLRELLKLAVLATSKRVNEAIAASSFARHESERTCESGALQLEQAFLPNDPGRMTARALMVQYQRSSAKLRGAVTKLEEEAAAAESTHAADVRALNARLQAQREALTECLVKELRNTEEEDETSIRSLRSHLMRTETARLRDVTERDATIESLRDELFLTNKNLDKEKKERAKENEEKDHRIATLEHECGRLGLDLASLDKAKREEQQRLALQLADEGADKEEQLRRRQEAADALNKNSQEMKETLEGQLAMLRAQMNDALSDAAKRYSTLENEKAMSEARLQTELNETNSAKSESEERWEERYKKLEQLKLQETTMLKNRVERLSKLQDAALNPSAGARGRALLFIESMKSKARQQSSISFRGEDDPLGKAPEEGGGGEEAARQSPDGGGEPPSLPFTPQEGFVPLGLPA